MKTIPQSLVIFALAALTSCRDNDTGQRIVPGPDAPAPRPPHVHQHPFPLSIVLPPIIIDPETGLPLETLGSE